MEPNEREVWWCALGGNIGHEQDGKAGLRTRPVLVVKKFDQQFLWAVPVMSVGQGGKFYVPTTYRGKTSYLLLSHLRVVNSERLIRRVRTLPKSQFDEVRERLRTFLA